MPPHVTQIPSQFPEFDQWKLEENKYDQNFTIPSLQKKSYTPIRNNILGQHKA